jgi:hypothetical protein
MWYLRVNRIMGIIAYLISRDKGLRGSLESGPGYLCLLGRIRPDILSSDFADTILAVVAIAGTEAVEGPAILEVLGENHRWSRLGTVVW